jgi:hypothetical protein
LEINNLQYNWEILPVACVFSTEFSPRTLEINNLQYNWEIFTCFRTKYRALPKDWWRILFTFHHTVGDPQPFSTTGRYYQ